MKHVSFLIFFGIAFLSLQFYENDGNVISLTKDNFDQLVINSDDFWLVEFFAPWCGHCKSFAPEYKKAAKYLKGIVKIGAVDMTTSQEIGARYDVKGFPTVKFFGISKKTPKEYSSARTAEAIADFIFAEFKSAFKTRSGSSSSSSSSGSSSSSKKEAGHESSSQQGVSDEEDVIVLTNSNFSESISNSKFIWFVKFYAPWCGHCKALKPEWASAATEMKGKVKFAQVDATVETTLASKYGIQGYPTIKYFLPGKSIDNPELYEGGRTKENLISFANNKLTEFGVQAEVIELLNEEIYNKECKTEKGLCIILVVPNIVDTSAKQIKEYLKILNNSANIYRSKPLKFFWFQSGTQLDLQKSFNLLSGFPSVLAVSPSKDKYTTMRAAFTLKDFKEFIEGCLIGKGGFYDIPKNIKFKNATSWDGKDAELTEKKEEL